MATLTVKLFGAPSVEMDGQGVVLPYRRAEALLYYLVLKKKASRSELVGLLWSDTDPSTALKNLRHAIYTVRKRLGFDLFLPGQRTILEIDPQLEIRCDVLDFLERGDPSLCTGTFLESFSLHSTSLFDIWAEEQRELLQSLYLKKLLESARSALASGDPVHAEKYALAYTALDPLDESAAVTLMDIYQAQKKYHKAIGTYQDLCRNLSAELSISPLKETTAAYYALINQWNDSAGEETSPEEDLVLGKDSALRSLHALLLGRDSRCSCMLVEGEAGVGKTYLLDHLLPDYSSPERLVCRCRCYESEMSVPLSPWSAVMMSVAAELDPRGIHVPDNYMKTAAALFPCLCVNTGDNFAAPDMGYPIQTNLTAAQESALLVLSIVSRHVPLLLVFEDIHWMDKGSCDLLSLFLRRLHGTDCIVICSSRPARPDYVDTFIAQSLRDHLLERHSLPPFTYDESCLFIRSRLGEEQGAQVARQLHDSTGGNALLLVQLLNSMEENHGLLQLPHDLDGIVSLRLSSLTLDERQVLDLISVFTEWASFDTISSILTKNSVDLVYICGQLCQRMLIVEEEQDGVPCYALAHEKIKAALIRQQSRSIRRVFHLRVAQYLEGSQDHTRRRSYDRLIYHYSEGGDRFNAFRCRVLALNAYTGLFYALMPTLSDPSGITIHPSDRLPEDLKALRKELGYLRQTAADPAQLDRLEMLLLHIKSSSDIYSGRYSAGFEALERLTHLCSSTGDRDMLAQVHLQYIYYGIQTHTLPVMEEHIAAGTALLEGQPDSPETGIYLRLEGLLHMLQGNHLRARALFCRSIRTFLTLPHSSDGRYAINVAGVYNYMAESFRLEGKYDASFHYYDLAIAYNRSRGYYPGAALFYTNYGVAAYQKGEREVARKLLEYAVEIYRSSRECSRYPIALSYLALYAAEEGSYLQAAEQLKQAHLVSDQLGSPVWKGLTIYMSWKVRRILQTQGVHVPELEALWPADEAEHCRWAISFLDRLSNAHRELEELRAVPGV